MATATTNADEVSRFESADADSSVSLTVAEFKNALHGKQPDAVVERKFNRADTNDDDIVSLDEWLAYRADLDQETTDKEKYTSRFNHSDLDEDGFLTYDEFQTTVKGKKPLIILRKRFLRADTDGDFLISMDEWLEMKNDNLEDPLKRTKFDLADLDGDNQLDPEEFSTVFPPKTPAKTVLRKFNREDENDDSLLTRDEWNPGGIDSD